MLRLLFRQGKSQLGAAPDGTLWFHSTFPWRRFAAVVICLSHFFANLGVTTQNRVALGTPSEMPSLPSVDGRGFIGHGEHLSVMRIHPLHLLTVEGACASASEYRKLIPALVDRAVPVDSLRDSQRGTRRLISRNQPRRGPRAEATERRVVGRRE